MTQSLAVAWAERGIRMNAVAPGFVESPLTAPILENQDVYERIRQRTPLSRWAVPDDVARVVLFLASPLAGFITGETIRIDGGYGITY